MSRLRSCIPKDLGTRLRSGCGSIGPQKLCCYSDSTTSATPVAAEGPSNVDLTMFRRSGSLDTGLGSSQVGETAGSVAEGGEGSTADENSDRGNWTSQTDCLLAILGYSVGVGTVWRFPYLCYKNGGGAFLIPYTIVLILVGIPIFFMELIIGQFTSCGPLTCWEFAPLFKGIGVAQLVVSAEVAIFYNMILAWAIFYLASSLINCRNLPWANCDNYWNTPLCLSKIPDMACNETDFIQASDGACYNNTQRIGVWNSSVFNITRYSPSNEYWNRRVLRISSGLEDMGKVEWDLALCLLLAWVITFVSIVNGIKVTGKVVYLTVLFPYVALIVLVVRGATLEGSVDGVIFYLKPDFKLLSKATIWSDAASQIFFGMSTCWGGLCTLSSYSRFHNSCYRDALFVTITNYFTGILAGFVIFTFLGFLASEVGTTVDKVADQGPGLAFVVFPDAVSRTTVSALWAVLFFMVLLSVGVNTQFTTVETIQTALMDQFEFLKPYKKIVVCCLCIALYLLGLPLCTGGGGFLLELMNQFCSGWNLLVIGLTETFTIAWVYGVRRFSEDVQIMLGSKYMIFWKLCWAIITPGILMFVLIFQWINYTTPSFNNVPYSRGSEALGWIMAVSSVIWIPVVAIYVIVTEADGNICQRLKTLINPTVYWGPALPKHRALVDYVEDFQVDPWNKERRCSSRHSVHDIAITTTDGLDFNGTAANSRMSIGSEKQSTSRSSITDLPPYFINYQGFDNKTFQSDDNVSKLSLAA